MLCCAVLSHVTEKGTIVLFLQQQQQQQQQ
jgi:hypothetical protein